MEDRPPCIHESFKLDESENQKLVIEALKHISRTKSHRIILKPSLEYSWKAHFKEYHDTMNAVLRWLENYSTVVKKRKFRKSGQESELYILQDM